MTSLQHELLLLINRGERLIDGEIGHMSDFTLRFS